MTTVSPNIVGVVAASLVAFGVLAFYLHEFTYRLGLRHGKETNALDLRHAREEAAEAEDRAGRWRAQSEGWRTVATAWMEIADRVRLASMTPGERRSAAEAASVAARASATMIGLRAASGERDLAGDIDDLSDIVDLPDGLPRGIS